jgi:hypothetical protein
MITTPRPRRGGTRLYCPMVDVAATEQGDGHLFMCGHPSRVNTGKGAKALRRHVRRDHMEPFRQGTEQILRYVQTGEWGGMRNVHAEITLEKPRRP